MRASDNMIVGNKARIYCKVRSYDKYNNML